MMRMPDKSISNLSAQNCKMGKSSHLFHVPFILSSLFHTQTWQLYLKQISPKFTASWSFNSSVEKRTISTNVSNAGRAGQQNSWTSVCNVNGFCITGSVLAGSIYPIALNSQYLQRSVCIQRGFNFQ